MEESLNNKLYWFTDFNSEPEFTSTPNPAEIERRIKDVKEALKMLERDAKYLPQTLSMLEKIRNHKDIEPIGAVYLALSRITLHRGILRAAKEPNDKTREATVNDAFHQALDLLVEGAVDKCRSVSCLMHATAILYELRGDREPGRFERRKAAREKLTSTYLPSSLIPPGTTYVVKIDPFELDRVPKLTVALSMDWMLDNHLNAIYETGFHAACYKMFRQMMMTVTETEDFFTKLNEGNSEEERAGGGRHVPMHLPADIVVATSSFGGLIPEPLKRHLAAAIDARHLGVDREPEEEEAVGKLGEAEGVSAAKKKKHMAAMRQKLKEKIAAVQAAESSAADIAHYLEKNVKKNEHDAASESAATAEELQALLKLTQIDLLTFCEYLPRVPNTVILPQYNSFVCKCIELAREGQFVTYIPPTHEEREPGGKVAQFRPLTLEEVTASIKALSQKHILEDTACGQLFRNMPDVFAVLDEQKVSAGYAAFLGVPETPVSLPAVNDADVDLLRGVETGLPEGVSFYKGVRAKQKAGIKVPRYTTEDFGALEKASHSIELMQQISERLSVACSIGIDLVVVSADIPFGLVAQKMIEALDALLFMRAMAGRGTYAEHVDKSSEITRQATKGAKVSELFAEHLAETPEAGARVRAFFAAEGCDEETDLSFKMTWLVGIVLATLPPPPAGCSAAEAAAHVAELKRGMRDDAFACLRRIEAVGCLSRRLLIELTDFVHSSRAGAQLLEPDEGYDLVVRELQFLGDIPFLDLAAVNILIMSLVIMARFNPEMIPGAMSNEQMGMVQSPQPDILSLEALMAPKGPVLEVSEAGLKLIVEQEASLEAYKKLQQPHPPTWSSEDPVPPLSVCIQRLASAAAGVTCAKHVAKVEASAADKNKYGSDADFNITLVALHKLGVMHELAHLLDRIFCCMNGCDAANKAPLENISGVLKIMRSKPALGTPTGNAAVASAWELIEDWDPDNEPLDRIVSAAEYVLDYIDMLEASVDVRQLLLDQQDLSALDESDAPIIRHEHLQQFRKVNAALDDARRKFYSKKISADSNLARIKKPVSKNRLLCGELQEMKDNLKKLNACCQAGFISNLPDGVLVQLQNSARNLIERRMTSAVVLSERLKKAERGAGAGAVGATFWALNLQKIVREQCVAGTTQLPFQVLRDGVLAKMWQDEMAKDSLKMFEEEEEKAGPEAKGSGVQGGKNAKKKAKKKAKKAGAKPAAKPEAAEGEDDEKDEEFTSATSSPNNLLSPSKALSPHSSRSLGYSMVVNAEEIIMAKLQEQEEEEARLRKQAQERRRQLQLEELQLRVNGMSELSAAADPAAQNQQQQQEEEAEGEWLESTTRRRRGPAAAAAAERPGDNQSNGSTPAGAPAVAAEPRGEMLAASASRFVTWHGDWKCGVCGKVNPLSAPCQQCKKMEAPCMDWCLGRCQRERCNRPHLPFDLPEEKPDRIQFRAGQALAVPHPEHTYRKGRKVAPPPQKQHRSKRAAAAVARPHAVLPPTSPPRLPVQQHPGRELGVMHTAASAAPSSSGSIINTSTGFPWTLAEGAAPAPSPSSLMQQLTLGGDSPAGEERAVGGAPLSFAEAARHADGAATHWPRPGEDQEDAELAAALAASLHDQQRVMEGVRSDDWLITGDVNGSGGGADLTAEEIAAGPVAGLSNATGEYNCFLNVVIQCLWSCAEFRRRVMDWSPDLYTADPVVEALRDLFDAFAARDATAAAAAAGGGAVPAEAAAAPRSVIDPGPLREALAAADRRFASREMADAGELLEELFKHVQAACAAAGAVPVIDPCFGLRVSESVTCRAPHCGKTTFERTFTQHWHTAAATGVRLISGTGRGLGHVLRDLLSQDRRTCDKDKGGCGEWNTINHFLDAGTAPAVFTLQLGWESNAEEPEDIGRTLRSLSQHIDLADIFQAVDPGALRYRMRSAVTYYGQHYQAFVLPHGSEEWVLVDDARSTVVGGWAKVVAKGQAGRLQPSVLFYERE